MPYVAAVTSAVVAFFVSVMLFAANPFERLAFTPADGRGLNPQLQNLGMVIHPPMLYLGYISITIPFAFAIAALLSRRLDTGWIHAIRKWTLVSWLFLSIGITLGMWWAYVELGWGGYWAWDPVENASLLPWLTMTAFLHSVMIQEKRGMLKRWNLGLVIGTFLLSIFGTFITRSGVIASVHSFTQSNVGYFFLAFLVVAAVLSFTLLYTRWPLLEAEVQLESMVSREAAFLFNNLLLVGIAFSVLWGTLFPILSELVRGTKITVGPPFFNRVNVPLGLLLLALTGIGPLIAWRKASPANLRRQFIGPVSGGGRDPGGAARRGRAGLLRGDGDRAGRLRGRDDRAGVLPRRARPAADARGVGPAGVPPAGRAEPAALRRLHRARRHPDLLRRVRRHGVQGRARGDAQAGRIGRAEEPVRPYLSLHPRRRLAVRGAQPVRDRGDRAGGDRREAGGAADEREAATRGQLQAADLRAVDRGRHPQQAARGPVYRVCRRGGRHRGGGVPVQRQSAGVVGVVRRVRAGLRRARDDVAWRRSDAGAGSRQAQGGYGVSLVGAGKE